MTDRAVGWLAATGWLLVTWGTVVATGWGWLWLISFGAALLATVVLAVGLVDLRTLALDGALRYADRHGDSGEHPSGPDNQGS